MIFKKLKNILGKNIDFQKEYNNALSYYIDNISTEEEYKKELIKKKLDFKEQSIITEQSFSMYTGLFAVTVTLILNGLWYLILNISLNKLLTYSLWTILVIFLSVVFFENYNNYKKIKKFKIIMLKLEVLKSEKETILKENRSITSKNNNDRYMDILDSFKKEITSQLDYNKSTYKYEVIIYGKLFIS